MGLVNENSLLDDRSFDAMIERGLADANAGRTISNYDMLRRIETWVLDGKSQGKKSTCKHERSEKHTMRTMIDPAVEERLHAALNALPVEEQQRVADYAHSLSSKTLKPLPSGKSLDEVRHLFGSLDAESAAEMRGAIKGCEQVDSSEW